MMFKLKLFFALVVLSNACFGALDLSPEAEAELRRLGQGAIEPGRFVQSPFDPSQFWYIEQNFGTEQAQTLDEMPSAVDFNKKEFEKSKRPDFLKPKRKIGKEGVFADDKRVNKSRVLKLFDQVKRNQKRTDARKNSLEDARRQAEVSSVDIGKNKKDLDGAAYLLAFANSGIAKK